MSTLKSIQLIQLFSYLLVNCQLLFYIVVFAEAIKATPISNFLVHRQSVDPVISKRYHIVYYTCLGLSLLLTIFAKLQSDGIVFLTSLVAFLCVVADVIIALKANIPLNTLVNSYTPGEELSRWENVRTTWLRYIRYRGIISSIGLAALIAGLTI